MAMSVAVQSHEHEPPLVFDGVGGEQLIIQTGTIVFEFHGSPHDSDWVRDRLTHHVLELPAASGQLRGKVSTTAWAAPSSMSYTPPNRLFLIDSGGRPVPVIDIDNRPVVEREFKPSSLLLPLLGAGWAVDATHTKQANDEVQLIVDVAIFGSSHLMRLAYSLFATIVPLTRVNP